MSGKSRREVEVYERLVPCGQMRIVTDKGRSLELLSWYGEPTVVVDGKYILRHSMLVRQIVRSFSEDAESLPNHRKGRDSE